MKATVNATCGFDTQAPAHRISDRQLIHESHEFSLEQWRADPPKILPEPRPALNASADPQISIPGFPEDRGERDDRKGVGKGKMVAGRVESGGRGHCRKATWD